MITYGQCNLIIKIKIWSRSHQPGAMFSSLQQKHFLFCISLHYIVIFILIQNFGCKYTSNKSNPLKLILELFYQTILRMLKSYWDKKMNRKKKMLKRNSFRHSRSIIYHFDFYLLSFLFNCQLTNLRFILIIKLFQTVNAQFKYLSNINISSRSAEL